MSAAIQQAREALGLRLRDIRRDAGLTGKQLAETAGWHPAKITKIEHGRQTPTEGDLRIWTTHCHAAQHLPDLIATVRHIDTMYAEWRRMLRAGTKQRQLISVDLEANTRLFRWHEPILVPGLLQTAEYAAAVMSAVIDFYGVPDDLDAGVATRMQRQQILYRGDHRFHFIIAEQALHTIVGDPDVMTGQLDRLLAIQSLPRITLGILPQAHQYRVPSNQFIVFDDRLVHVETISAELAITQPHEIQLYTRAFQNLAHSAVHGAAARNLINVALTDLQQSTDLPDL